MKLLVILSTLLTATIAAKLPPFAYSPPASQHHQAGADTTQGFAHTGTSNLNGNAGENIPTQTFSASNGPQDLTQHNGQAVQNGLTQTFSASNGPQDLTQHNGQAVQNGLTQTFGPPNGPQDLSQFNGHIGQNGLTQTFAEHQGLTQSNGYSGQNGLTQTYGAPNESQELIQSNGHSGQNGHTQTNSGLAEPQDLTQTNGHTGQNQVTQSFVAPATPQELTQNGHAGTSVFISSFEEPVGFFGQSQQENPTQQDVSFEAYEGPTGPHYQAQGPNEHDLPSQTLHRPSRPHFPEQPHVAKRPVLDGGVNGCLEGQVHHADGSCVTPEVTRSVYVFGVPEADQTSTSPSPRLPAPRVHEHVLLIRAPERWAAPQPLVVPPPAQKSVVYVLRKDLQDEGQSAIEAPVTPPAHPEVFFVNYKDGDNLSLPNGLDLQQALQGAVTGPATLLDTAAESDAAVDSQGADFSSQGDSFSLGGQSDEDLLPVGYSDGGFAPGHHRHGNFVLEGYSDDDLSLEVQTDGTTVVLGQRGDDVLENHSDEGSLAGHRNGGLVLEGKRNRNLVQLGHSDEDFLLRGHGHEGLPVALQSEEDLVLRGNGDDGLVLSGHRGGGLAARGHSNTAFSVLRNESPDYQFSSVENSFVEASSSREVSDSSVLGGSALQVGRDNGHTVPAQLLSLSFDGSAGSFSGFTSKGNEAPVRGVEGTTFSASPAAALGGALYGPPTSPPAGPAQLYAAP